MATRRKVSEEVRREAVALTRQPGVRVAQVARDIGVNTNQLYGWRREQDAHGAKAFTGSGSPRDQEFMAVKRELARVKKERDFLRDAAAFFARESS